MTTEVEDGVEQGQPDVIMLWAASTLCFFGFMRAGELTVPSDNGFDKSTHLAFKDVAVNPKVLKVRLKKSKTDPFRVGVDIFVGRTDSPLCPVAAVLAYMVARGAGPALGSLLTRARFVDRVRAALREANVDYTPYSGHSFRIGAATTADGRVVLICSTSGHHETMQLAQISRCLVK